MIRLIDLLKEAKQVGTLYHYTSILSLLKILDTDILGDRSLGKYATVSLTRDKNFHKRTKIIPTECRITIDGTGLSNRYKIRPYQWNAAHFQGKPATKFGEIEDQMEEEVKGYIQGISKWIESVDIFELELDPLPFDDDFTNEAKDILNIPQDKITVKDIVDFVKNHVKKVNII